MKVLNLYACLGGNRYKWDEVADIEVTAVELDSHAAELYAERFPNDTVIVADAHQYLLDHYKEFDFIWSSPPCPTHSRIQYSMKTHHKMQYPDMRLYEEIIFLQAFYNGKWTVENVIPFYEPLIPAKKRGRHLYWTNFALPNVLSNRQPPSMTTHGDRPANNWKAFADFHEVDVSKYNGKQSKGKMARNLVDYEAGKTIFETACGIVRKSDVKQLELL
jgi:DNA (cytosine-5)-methyltransferase 1